ncbi:MAG: hypothetical protein ACOCRX_02620 [Candidatus Woesearchaeota archaeon]
MNKKIELRKDNFRALKGIIKEVNKDNNKVIVSLNLGETFKDPAEDNLEVEILVTKETKLQQIVIVVEAGEVVNEEDVEENKEKIEIEELKKHQEVLISPMNPADLYNIFNLDKLEAEEIIVFKN